MILLADERAGLYRVQTDASAADHGDDFAGADLRRVQDRPTPVVTPQPMSVALSRGMSGRIFTSMFSCTSSCSAKLAKSANWKTGSSPRRKRGGPAGSAASPALSQRLGRPERQ